MNQFQPLLRKLLRQPGWLVLLAFACCAYYRIGAQSPERDELITFGVTRLPLGELFINRADAGHLPLYFLLAKASVSLLPPGYPALLLPSILAGGVGLWGMARLLLRLRLGLWAWPLAAAFGLHPTYVFFARYARPWMLVACLIVWILLAWLELLRAEGYKRTIWLWLASLLGCAGAFVNPTVMLVWFVVLVGSAFSRDVRLRAGRAIWLPAGMLLLHLVALTTLLHRNGMQPLRWVEPLTHTGLVELVLDWLGGKAANLRYPSLLWCLPLLVAGLAGRGMYVCLCPASRWPEFVRGYQYFWRIGILTGALPLAFFLCSSLFHNPFALYRYGLIAFPGLWLALVLGVCSLPRHRVRVVLVALLIVCGVMNIEPMLGYRRNPMRQQLRELAKKYDPQRDVVVVFDGAGLQAVKMFNGVDAVLALNTIPNVDAWVQVRQAAGLAQRVWVYNLWNKGGIITEPAWQEVFGKPAYSRRVPGCQLLRYDAERGAPFFNPPPSVAR